MNDYDDRSYAIYSARAEATGCHQCLIVTRGVKILLEANRLIPFDSWEEKIRINSQQGISIESWGQIQELNVDFYVEDRHFESVNAHPWIVRRPHITAGEPKAPALRFAKKTLGECLQSHCCSTVATSDFLPKRLVDVQPQCSNGNIVKVLDSNSPQFNSSAVPAYVALSYCWGKQTDFRSKILCMRKDNVAEMATGKRLWELPQVFRDAVTTTRSLGFRYLWIDALCIAQGDQSEWKEESLRMAETYRNAVVTLVADASESAAESFLNTQRYRKLREGHEIPGSEIRGVHPMVFIRPQVESLHRNAKVFRFPRSQSQIQTRGWTLQERLLSRRVLSFRHAHVEFHCVAGHQMSEDGDIYQVESPIWGAEFVGFDWWSKAMLNLKVESMLLDDASLIALWRKVCLNYVNRELTCEEDRLVAIAGVAKTLRSYTSPTNTYMAGLWKNTIVNDLQWYHRWDYKGNHLDAPSWSWGSASGKILWVPEAVSWTVHTDLVRTSWTSDDFGHVRFGPFIVLHGPSIEAQIKSDRSICPLIWNDLSRSSDTFIGGLHLDGLLEVINPGDGSSVTVRRSHSGQDQWGSEIPTVQLLLLASNKQERRGSFLILAKAAGCDDKYTRIGLWSIPEDHFTPESHWLEDNLKKILQPQCRRIFKIY